MILKKMQKNMITIFYIKKNFNKRNKKKLQTLKNLSSKNLRKEENQIKKKEQSFLLESRRNDKRILLRFKLKLMNIKKLKI